MKRLSKIVSLFVLVGVLSIAGIAATPAVLSKPAAPTIEATANAEELTISWDRIPGAQFYTVGWINWTEGAPVLAAEGDWLSLFHYTTVAGDRTSYTVKRQNGGDNHYAIIRATDVEGSTARFNGPYSPWSEWSSSPAKPVLGITGLPTSAADYLSVGDTATFDQYSVTVTSIAAPQTVSDREPPYGRRWLITYVHLDNGNDSRVILTRGLEWFLSTELDIGFSWNSNRPVEQGETLDTSLLFDVPQNATTAVLVIRPFTETTSEVAPQPFRFTIPAP